jgi:predicted membrane protein
MQTPEKQPTNFFTKYLSKVEMVGWLMCTSSMLLIIFVKETLPAMLPFAWVGAIVGALLIGWGAGRKHKRK